MLNVFFLLPLSKSYYYSKTFFLRTFGTLMQAHRTFGTFGTYLISLLYISLQCCSCCPNSYIFCANHTGTCVGNGMVAYGKQKIYSYKSSSTSISCRNAQFGNPISGAKKCCSYVSYMYFHTCT